MTHLAKACLALAVPLTLAADPSTPTCAQTGVAYNDMYRNATVNGAFQANALACQNLCKATLFCAYFTYYNNTGGCWLQGNQVSTFASDKAVSGPVACPGEEATSAFLNSVKTNAPKAKDAVVATPTPQATTDVKLGASPESGSSESGGFPWWGWAAGGVGAALVGGGAAAYLSSGSDSKKKKKTRAAKTSHADVEEPAEAASESLVNSSSSPPLYPVANTAASPPAYGYNLQLQQPYYSSQVAYPGQSAAPGYAYYYQQ